MKTLYKLLTGLFIFAIAMNCFAQPPTFQLVVRNMLMGDTAIGTGSCNMLKFDIWLLWTFPANSDPFNYGSCQYCLSVNPAFIAGQTWTIKITDSQLPTSLQPVPSVNNASAQIRYTGNLPGPIYTVSSVFPGTKVATTRITSNLSFPIQPLSLAWRNSGTGLITKISYLDPNGAAVFITDPNSTDVDSSGLNGFFGCASPVELSSFTSTIKRNSVELNWSTVNETNNSGFDIERKLLNSNDWSKVGNITGYGTTYESKSYSFSDRVNSGKYNYRLKQIDYNGNFAYYDLHNEVEVGIPNEFAISQNYPNPFNPTTKIDYDLPFDSKVSILLYDISGREVGNLINDTKTAGYYTLQFNASDFASGMYFYRITATGHDQNFVQTKKMMLIK